MVTSFIRRARLTFLSTDRGPQRLLECKLGGPAAFTMEGKERRGRLGRKQEPSPSKVALQAIVKERRLL